MNTETLKSVYENMPKSLKRVLAPLFVRSMVGNEHYKKMYEELEKFDALSQDEQELAQFALLKNQCVYAFDHTKYYRALFDEAGLDPRRMKSPDDISVLPLTDKRICQQQGDCMYSDQDIACYEGHTSGSTGKVFRVLLDRDSIYFERAFVNHYLAKFGYDPKRTRTLALWGHNKDADYYYSPLKNEIVVSPFKLFNENGFQEVWNIVSSFGPEAVAGYPSAVTLFCKLLQKYGKKLSPKFVQFYGETATVDDIATVRGVLACPALATYGHTERCAFMEKYQDGYHINKRYGYTELIPTENPSSFRIVSSGFLSKKMPLIRYVTDDYVVFDEEGRMDVRGHTYSEARVIAKNGARIYKGTLSPHTAQFEKVRLYQYVQDTPGHVFLDVVLDDPLTEDDIRQLNAYFERKCEGLLDIELRVVKGLRTNARGKYTWLVDDIDYSQHPELRTKRGI